MAIGLLHGCHLVLCWTLVLVVTSDMAFGECEEKFKVIPGHTACLKKSPKVTVSGTSTADKDLIVKLHNDYRRKVKDAAYMLKVRWDDEVAMVARKWAENCQTHHDDGSQRFIPGRFSLGQNIATGVKNGKQSWGVMVDLWYNETSNFTYGNSLNVFLDIGHYTQLVWADTYLIGCGFALCDTTPFYVCDYAPSGNTPASKVNTPYNKTSGTPGSSCRTNDNGLCDCGGKRCYGDRPLTPACSCSCDHKLMPAFSEADTCQLNCSVPDVPSTCGDTGYYKVTGCNQVYITFYCPHMCKTCPYADASFVGHSGAITHGLRTQFIVLALFIWTAL